MKRFLLIPLLVALSARGQVTLGGGNTSSRYASVFSTEKNPGVLQTSEAKQITIAAGSTIDILPTYSGSGYVSEIFIAGSYYKDLEVIVTVDGEATPSIDLNAPFLFGAGYCNVGSFFGKWFSQNNYSNSNDCYDSGTFRLPIPYSTSIHIQVKNNGAGASTFFYIVANHTGVTDDFIYTQHLYAHSVNIGGIAANAESDLVNVTTGKPGVLAAVAWTYDGLPGSVNPLAAGVEGPFRIYIDGSGTASYTSSGSEDFFGMGFYFAGASSFGMTNAGASPNPTMAPSSSDVVLEGINTNGGGTPQTWAASRVFAVDPIAFTNGLRVSWQCGVTADVSFTGTCTLLGTVFYYTKN